MAGEYKKWLTDINLFVYMLVVIFNLASWIDLSAIYVELPLFVNRLPEGWELPSYLIIIISVCKVGLVVYIVLKKLLKERLQDVPIVYFIILSGAGLLLMAAFLWEKTMEINGAEHSVALLALIAALSMVDCTSTAVFYPYVARYSSQYVTALFLGEGLCQVIPAIISMFQGVGEHPDCVNKTLVIFNETLGVNFTQVEIIASYPAPKFSVQAFFTCMFVVMICSAVAFSFLHFLPYCKKEQLFKSKIDDKKAKEDKNLEMQRLSNHKKNSLTDRTTSDLIENGIKEDTVVGQLETSVNGVESGHGGLATQYDDEESEQGVLTTKYDDLDGQEHPATTHRMLGGYDESSGNTDGRRSSITLSITTNEYAYWIGLMTWDFLIMYGVVPAIQPYSALPYGSRAYTLSIRLGVAMNPLSSIVSLFLPTRSKLKILILSVLGTLCGIYMVVFACFSPDPPMKGMVVGETLMILIYVLMMALFNYARSCIMYCLKEKVGADGLLWGGVSMHVGVTIGSIVTFVLTSVVKVFEAEKPCPGM